MKCQKNILDLFKLKSQRFSFLQLLFKILGDFLADVGVQNLLSLAPLEIIILPAGYQAFFNSAPRQLGQPVINLLPGIKIVILTVSLSNFCHCPGFSGARYTSPGSPAIKSISSLRFSSRSVRKFVAIQPKIPIISGLP